jgi:hypothetical protein
MRTSVRLQKKAKLAAELEATLAQLEALRIAEANQPHADIGDLIVEKTEAARRLRRRIRERN